MMIKRLIVLLVSAMIPAYAQEAKQETAPDRPEPKPNVEFYSWSVNETNYSVHFLVSFDQVLSMFVPWGASPSREVEMKDSLGNKAKEAQSFQSMHKIYLNDDDKIKVSVNGIKWIPSAESTWVDVKLSVPCYIYGNKATKLVEFDVKENKPVTVTLKNAGFDGSDVQVTLKHGTEMGCTGMILSSDKLAQMYFLGMKIFNVDDIEFSSSGSVRTSKKYVCNWKIKGENKVKIAIDYANGIKKIMVPIEKRIGIMGELPLKKGEK